MNKIIIILLIVLNTTVVHCPEYKWYPDIAIDLFRKPEKVIPWKLSRKRLTDQRYRNW